MKHASVSSAWRPVRARGHGRGSQGALSALIFNVCLLLLPVACAVALLVVARDHLYTYEYSPQGARDLAARVEKLNSTLIQLDFDRQRQWDDLVAMELVNNDVAAARGFLLSARSMLPSRDANQLSSRLHHPGDDAEFELAALQMLTPGTRTRYESTVPLLSRRAASGAGQRVAQVDPEMLGDQRDFELLAHSMLSDPDADPVQFVLTGLGLGLGGEFTPRMAEGATALIAASRRDDFPNGFGDEISNLLGAAVSVQGFRAAAYSTAQGDQAGSYVNASAAFRTAVQPQRLAAAKHALDQIGAIVDATSSSGAAALITHANSLRDLPKLQLIAQAAGDRSVAAAKRLPRDGRLLAAAHGELTFTKELSSALAVAGLAFLGMLGVLLMSLFNGIRHAWLRSQDEEDSGELIDSFRQNWRPL